MKRDVLLMKKLKTRIISGAVTLIYSTVGNLAFSAPLAEMSASAAALPLQTCNISANDYDRAASPVYSYLYEQSGSLVRVEYAAAESVTPTWEVFGKNGEIESGSSFGGSGSLWGGFFHGEKYDFYVWGEKNSNESDKQTVLTVWKYGAAENSESPKELGKCVIAGSNTTVPFDAGSLRMDEENGILYIHTAHEMYQTADGINHQANMSFAIDEETMTVKQKQTSVSNNSTGYVSHSFNQFVKADGGTVYRVDHGDAIPRAVYLTKASADKINTCTGVHMLEIGGVSGDNDTGVSVGGMELTSKNVIVAGNSVDQESDTWNPREERNIFVSIAARDTLSTKTVWLTDLVKGGRTTARTPQLVKISDNALMVLWEQQDKNLQVTTKMAMIDGSGNLIGFVQSYPDMRLSDCQPIPCSDGLVKWYVTNNGSPVFYSVDPDDAQREPQQREDPEYNVVTAPAGDEPYLVGDDVWISVDTLKKTDYLAAWELYIFRNPGYSSLDVTLDYNTAGSGLQLALDSKGKIQYSFGSALGISTSFSYSRNSKILMTTFTHKADNPSDGSVVSVMFKIPETVRGGEEFQIPVSINGVKKLDGTDLTGDFKVTNGTIHILPAKEQIGDVDENGTVEIADAVLLSRICTEDQTADCKAAKLLDINSDGIANLRDVLVLLQILASP